MNYSTVPLHVATYFGIAFSALGFISALIIMIRKLLDPGIQVGWSSLMCVILIVAGIIFLMLGIIGVYVGKMIMTQSAKPLYVIRETLNLSSSDIDSDRKIKNRNMNKTKRDPAD